MSKRRSSRGLSVGKAPPSLLAALATIDDADVLQGPGIGLDAAVLRVDRELLIATSDPITFVDADVGALAVAVNANDIHALGGEPKWMLATVLAPSGFPEDQLRSLLDDLRTSCQREGIALVGGHTEVTDAVTRAVISCALIGIAPLGKVIPSDGARHGDAVIQAGAAAVEGTALLGRRELLESPGMSVARAARAMRSVGGVHAMHDVTEGGIATAALELAEAAGLSPTLTGDDIIWLPETLAVCEERGLDPLGLLGSGTLLAAVAPAAVDLALAELSGAGVQARVIGRVEAGIRATLSHVGQMRPLPRFARDEALRALADGESPLPPLEGAAQG